MFLSKKSLRSIKRIANNHDVQIIPPHAGAGQPLFTIAGHTARVGTLYHGGDSVAQHLEGADLAIVQCGAKGQWVAVLPAQILFDLFGNQPVLESDLHARPESD